MGLVMAVKADKISTFQLQLQSLIEEELWFLSKGLANFFSYSDSIII